MKLRPPSFASTEEYRARLSDPDFWRPHATGLLGRHGLPKADDFVMGEGSTFPVLLTGDCVIKFFGFGPRWRQACETEKLVLKRLTNEGIAPPLLASGSLHKDWRYLILGRLSGRSWEETAGDRIVLAQALGDRIARIHRVSVDGLPEHEVVGPEQLERGLRQSSLPSRLLEQATGFLGSAIPNECAFVHGDLIGRHVFVEGHRIAGIIDWGDALATDRHYELAKLHLDLFGCDKRLLQAFLAAADWPAYSPIRAMQMALQRQVHCSAQHFTCDVFHLVGECLELEDICTLDALADALFEV